MAFAIGCYLFNGIWQFPKVLGIWTVR